MNAVVLIGRLSKDPELDYTPQNQTPVCKFTLAVDREKKDSGADFIRVTTWNKTAELCNKYLVKGRQCAIHGRIQTGSYKNRDGVTVYTTEVIADSVMFLDKAKSDPTVSDLENAVPIQTVFDPTFEDMLF